MSSTRDKDLRMEESSIARDPFSKMDTFQYWYAGLRTYRLVVPHLHAVWSKRVTIQHRGSGEVSAKDWRKTHRLAR
jgi:Txe/YoeB family toxin of Txe-Axe toxin-antitoxin module